MNIADALARASAQGLPRLDAQLLLLHALGQTRHDRSWLLAHDHDLLDDAAIHRYAEACRRREAGEPLAYVVGQKDFFGLPLAVDARVLVPRPETETLVDWALELLDARAAGATASTPLPPARVADLGTGSGAIALALCQTRPGTELTAVDRSADALDVARHNAARLGLPIRCVQSSWMDAVVGRFDLIVSNPPYVATGDPHLAALTHEPLQALVAGADGLDDLRSIVSQAGAHLAAGGWLLLEHGYDQAEAVRALLATHGFVQVASRNDLAGIARCSGGQWPIAG